MGDADDLREAGLNWGWEDNYPDFRERPTISERWMSRKKRPKIVDGKAQEIAEELIDVKDQIRQLREKEGQLKESLGLFLPTSGWLDATVGGVYYIIENITSWRNPRLKTKEALRFITQKYGEDAALLVAENCSEKAKRTSAIYVRPFQKSRDSSEQVQQQSLDDFDDDIAF